MAYSRLPPRLQRRRIDIHIGEFLRWLEKFYAKRGWSFGPIQLPAPGAELGEWLTRDVDVQIVDLDEDDGRVVELEVRFRNTPSVVARDDGVPQFGWEHAFAIVLPAAYPTDLKMRIVNLTETIHPRMMSPDKGAPACIFPNAELDLVLREVLFNLLFKPDVVRPPVLFDGEDNGYRPREMKWYAEYGPQRLYDELQAAWNDRQQELAGSSSPPVPVVETEAPAPTSSPFVIRSEENAADPASSPRTAARGESRDASDNHDDDDRSLPPGPPPPFTIRG